MYRKNKNREKSMVTNSQKLFYTFIIIALLFLPCQSQEIDIIAKGAKPELVAKGFSFTEGPAADSIGNVFFTDQPNNRIHKWSVQDSTVSIYMEYAGRANGLFFDDQGYLIAAADENSELWQINDKKEKTVLLDKVKGGRPNGPNDLWIDKKGGIYFTDPFYSRSYWEEPRTAGKYQGVYYLSPDGQEVKIVAEDLVKPNGIIGTADGEKLYIADIGAGKTYVYYISPNGTLTDKKLFAPMGSDGMTIDNQGNVYLTGDGVTVFNKEGEKIEHIPINEDWTANVTFGGSKQQTLFITAMDSLYKLNMNVSGTRW